MSTREAIFAGKFYPSNADETRKLIEYIEKKEINNLSHIINAKVDVIGGVVPHAGLMFCGYQAVHFFHYIQHQDFDTVVILSPSHRGTGPEVSVDSHDHWKIPGAQFDTDIDFRDSGLLEPCSNGQYDEHAAEVILPYLNYYRPELRKISIVTVRNPKLDNARKVAQALIEYEKQTAKKLLIIASSDFNHFDNPDAGREKDDYVLEAIKNFNEEDVIKQVRGKNISVCGYGPIVALMHYAQLKNSNARFSVLRRGHSGEVMPSDEVVDYVSLLCAVPQ